MCAIPMNPQLKRLKSAGIPVFSAEVRIVDEDDNEVPRGEVGEICGRGPMVMKGYWKQPEATAAALRGGWMHTGDAGYMDEDGYIYLVDRTKDMIVTGGENVFSVEVEAALYEHPAVLEAAVIGVPDEKWGEAVHAVVVLKPGKSADDEEIMRHCHGRIANYKCPKSVSFENQELPKSGAGKILKRDLRTPFWEGHDRPDSLAARRISMHDSLSTTALSRRQLLCESGLGLGRIALASLLASETFATRLTAAEALDPQVPRKPHFAPKARRVIYLFLHGGPSHVDLFDPKPDLAKYAGQPLPESFGPVMTRRNVAKNALLGPIRPFQQHGQSGLPLSDFVPHLARHADELCVIRSVHGDSVNHPQSVYQMNTGSILMGRPSLGSWVAYGLGTENENLPSFVVMPDARGGVKGGPPAWGAGYLPASFQGTPMRSGPQPILNLRPGTRRFESQQSALRDFVRQTNDAHLQARDQDDALAAQLRAFELAYRMQASAPEVVDTSDESQATLDLYGIGAKPTHDFGTKCLLARRMIEAGVRFVQLYSGDTNGWDAHNDVEKNHSTMCGETDLPIAGLLADLKQRGLLDDHAGDLRRRIWPHADERKGKGARPQPLGLQHLASRCRGQTRRRVRRHRRHWTPRRRQQGPRPRPSRHDSSRPRLRPRTTDLLPQRPRRTSDRRRRSCRTRYPGVT